MSAPEQLSAGGCGVSNGDAHGSGGHLHGDSMHGDSKHAHGSSPAHSHGISAASGVRWLAAALAVNVGFMGVEVAAGVLAHSLALLSDAAHMLTDAAAIGLALLAARIARRRAQGAMTYGFGRAEILSAQTNGVTLVILSGFIVYEGASRLASPPRVDAWVVLWIALAGVLVNGAAALALARANRESLNVRGALQHNLIDAYAAVATAVAAGAILLTGFQRADPLASLLIAVPMMLTGARLVKSSGRVFLEAAPSGIDPQQIGAAMVSVPAVREVHDLHVWEITSGFPALSAHVLVARDDDCHQARRSLESMLHDRFAISHTTLQVDHQDDRLLTIQPPGRTSSTAG